MSARIGGSDAAAELAGLADMSAGVPPIGHDEYSGRLARLRDEMQARGIGSVFLNAGANLLYFTGVAWTPSERMVGALVPLEGDIAYIAPAFERGTLEGFLQLEGAIHGWQEHESPFALLAGLIRPANATNRAVALDETLPFFMSEGVRQSAKGAAPVSAGDLTAACRIRKSAHEIALIRRAMEMTMAVQAAAARILRPGIEAGEVADFIHAAHKAVGAPGGSTFCIVLFGSDTAFPHGVKSPKPLETNDLVLIDTGCRLHDYQSDITRTYIFGEASPHQQKVWTDERQAQRVAFESLQIGASCGSVDDAVRAFIETENYGPGYQLPGLGHRTGHGIGLNIHEPPFLVKNDSTILEEGMCFSIEPMLCLPGEFGVRLEDHVHMGADGPHWFTEPARAIDDPF